MRSAATCPEQSKQPCHQPVITGVQQALPAGALAKRHLSWTQGQSPFTPL